MTEEIEDNTGFLGGMYPFIVIYALNAEYDLRLEMVSPEETSRSFGDVIDVTNNALLEFVNFNNTNSTNQLNAIVSRLDKFSKTLKGETTLYVVFIGENRKIEERLSILSARGEDQYKIQYVSQKRILELIKKHKANQQYGYRIEEVTQFLNKRKDDVFSSKQIKELEHSVDNHQDIFEQEINNFIKNAENENTSFFLVGSSWAEEDQTERFLENGVWENGYDDKYIDTVQGIVEGDYVIIKSTYALGKKSILRVKAVGRVVQNFNDGKRIQVKWTLKNVKIDISGLGYYRDTIQRVVNNDIKRILETLQNNNIILSNLEITQQEGLGDLKEYFIDQDGTILYGQDIGNEIKDYNLFILPRKDLEGLGEYGLVHQIFSILRIQETEVNFSNKDIRNKYKYLYANALSNRNNYHFLFVETRDKNKKEIAYSKQLLASIKFVSKLKNNTEITKVFIPLRGPYDSNISYSESLSQTINGIKEIQKLINLDKIRINFPQSIEENDLINYRAEILELLELDPHESIKDKTLIVNSSKDKMPFHLDNVEVIDRLNRDPIAKSLARLINKEIFKNKGLRHSFMIHLQGEWGSGKSTFLNLLETNLSRDHKWSVINFNAWQNQHISPPWWSFIDQVYRQGTNKLKKRERIRVKFQETARRILWYSGWNKVFALVLTIVLLAFLLINIEGISDTIASFSNKDNYKSVNEEDKAISDELNLSEQDSLKLQKEVVISNDVTTDSSKKPDSDPDIPKLIISLGSIVGLIYSLSKFISTPLLLKSSGQAKSFVLRASNPMMRIKKHFNDLIAHYNKEGYNVAVFIDDIDRCNREYTVELLEGIQTLFKETKVLYVVAGDKNWITSCFENNYEEFKDTVTGGKENLGELFLEKAFQLSVRMPEVSEQAKENYWKHILGIKEGVIGQDLNKVTDEKKSEIKTQILIDYNKKDKNQDWLKEVESQYQLSEEVVSDIAIEALDENTEDVKHLFVSFHQYINPNPRSIKRLANNYTMTRNTLIAERKQFEPNKLFRWLLLNDMHPKLIANFQKQGSIGNINNYIEEQSIDEIQSQVLNKIIYGSEVEVMEKLKIEEMQYIIG